MAGAGALAIAVFAAYSDIWRAPFVLDDVDAITENPTLRHFWRVWGILRPANAGATVSGRPVLNFSFACNYALTGERVWSYHALNIAIHLLAGLALWAVVRRTLQLPRLRPRFGEAAPALGLAVAAVWLLHPLQTESVAYTCQRAESLAGLFALLTFWGFVIGASSPRPRPWDILTVAACLLCVGTKEIAVVLPPLILLYDRTFVAGTFAEAWRRRRGLHLCLFATWLPLVLLVAGTGWNRGGTAGFNVGVAPWAYWLTQFPAVVRYLRLAAWPHPLVFDYGPFWVSGAQAAPFAAVVLVLIVATVVALVRRPAVGFLGAFFFLNLAPTSIVPGTNQMIVEHRMYLPLAALVTLGVLWLFAAWGRRSPALWLVLSAGLGITTFARNATYRTARSLWTDTAAKAPGNPRAHYNLGIAYSDRGDFAWAVEEDRAALRLSASPTLRGEIPVLENKLGYDLEQLGRLPEAVSAFAEAVRLSPGYARAQSNLAYAFVLDGRPGDALPAYRRAVRLEPGDATAWMGLGYALIMARRPEEALGPCAQAVRLQPGMADAHNTLGMALAETGRQAQAVSSFETALRLNSRQPDVENNLGNALSALGRSAEAVAHYQAALAVAPNYAPAHRNLGEELRRAGRYAEADREMAIAARLENAAAR